MARGLGLPARGAGAAWRLAAALGALPAPTAAAARSEDGATLRVDIELDPRLLEDGGQAVFEDRLSEQMGLGLGRLLRS